MKPPKSILRKSSDRQKPIQRVKFTKAIARHTKIRDPTLKPEEREFVVDSGASMHMIIKKDLSDAEMDTLTKSCHNRQWRSADA